MAIKVSEVSRGADHALASFAGYMQLGDTYSVLGKLNQSIECYKEGLKVQIQALGETDPRVAETCRKCRSAALQCVRCWGKPMLCNTSATISKNSHNLDHGNFSSLPNSLSSSMDSRMAVSIGLIHQHPMFSSKPLLTKKSGAEVVVSSRGSTLQMRMSTKLLPKEKRILQT